MTRPITIILLSFHFDPSNEIGARRPSALVRFLVTKGFRVVVVSAFGGSGFADEVPGIVRIRVNRPRKVFTEAVLKYKRASERSQDGARNAGSAADHALDTIKPSAISQLRGTYFRLVYLIDDYKHWAWRASNAARRAGRTYGASLLISSSPPTSVLLAGERAARKLGIPHIADLRDPWIDALPQHQSLSLSLQKCLEKKVIRGAAAVTTTSSAVSELIANRFPERQGRFHVVRNGFDGEPKAAVRDTGHCLTILFAGELYVGRNPFPFLMALEALLSRNDTDASRISVTFMGRASQYDGQSLDTWMSGRACKKVVRVLGQLSQEAVAEAVANSTVLLNLSQQQRLSIPAKTFEHLISGREMLLLCEDDCETARLVAGIKGVIQVDPDDAAKLELVLADLYRRHVLEGTLIAPESRDIEQFSRTSANESMLKVIRGVLGS